MKFSKNKVLYFIDFLQCNQEYYSNGSNSVDLLKDKKTREYLEWGKEAYIDLAHENPIKHLMKSAEEFFHLEGELFCLNEDLEEYLTNHAFIKHFGDIIEFKSRKFFKERLERKLKEMSEDNE